MKGKLTIGRLFIICKKTILWSASGILLLLVIAILLLQTAFFQNYIVTNIIGLVNSKTDQETSIQNICIKWFDRVEIENLLITDYNQNVLFDAERVVVDYDLFNLISGNQLSLNKLEIENGVLNLIKYDDEYSINLIRFVESIKTLRPPKDSLKQKESGIISLDNIRLSDFTFSYNNHQKDSLPIGKLDMSHLAIEISESKMNDFKLIGDTIEVDINSFSGHDLNSGFLVNSLVSSFELSNQRIIFEQLDLKLSESTVSDHVLLEFSGLSDFSTFNDSVHLQIELKNSFIHPRDLSYFVDLDENFPALIFSGDIDGKIKDFSIDDMSIGIDQQTFLNGDVYIFGLPNLTETFINLNVTEGSVIADDLSVFLEDIPDPFETLNKIEFSGKFSGFPTDFVAKAKFSTKLGVVATDLNFKFPSGWENASYSGKLIVDNFDVGTFLNEKETFQRINLEGLISGTGLTIGNANFFAEAKATNSGIQGYNYKMIKAKGKFANKFFDGTLSVDDPNLKFATTGNIDLASKPEKIAVSSEISKLDFKELGFIDSDLTIKSSIDFKLLGIDIDSLNSEALISNLEIDYDGRSMQLDTVRFSTNNEGSSRDINFELPEFHGLVKGKFSYTNLIRDFKAISKEVLSYFDQQVDSTSNFEMQDFEEYNFDFELTYGDVNKYLDFLNQEIYMSPRGFIEGDYYQRKNALLYVFASIDSLNYHGLGFEDNDFEFNIIKDLDSIGIVSLINVSSKRQHWIKIPESSNLNFEGVWKDDQLSFTLNVDQEETNSSAYVNANLNFIDQKLIFKVLPSDIKILGNQWVCNSQNRIEYKKGSFHIDDLDFIQDKQEIRLSGHYTDTTESYLSINFKEFDLHTVNTISPMNIGGVLNGALQIEKNDQKENYHYQSDLSIDSLAIDDLFVGNMKGSSEWEVSKSRIKLDFGIDRESINTISLTGYYYPDNDTDQLDLDMSFKEADLKLASPFVENSISDLEGWSNGNINISGNMDLPVLRGNSTITGGKFTYDYLGVTYLFSGDIEFNNESIDLKAIELVDRDNNKALINGSVAHLGFKDFEPTINLTTSNFMFLNTSPLSEELYYGTAYASGTIDVLGTFEDLIIEAKIKSEKGTKLYFPLEDDTEVGLKEYISFVDFSDSTRIGTEELIKSSISGVKLDFDIEVTPDAYVELIFDLRAGDIIRGTGNGNLNLLLDTNGEFELFGSVSIEEGAYNFTSSLAGATILSKEFNIEPEGTITWFGDPYAGVLNLDANYRQLASFSDFDGDETEVSTQVPVLVVLSLEGEMLSPDIGFEIKLDDSQSLASINDQVSITQINDDEQELKRQVFSLLILRKFSPRNSPLSISGGQMSSLSEFLSNQLSYYASQFNENLEIDLDLASLDQNALNALQLRLSYTFLDGRLRVSGGGGFNQSTTTSEESNSFVGDWSVQYLLTSDGRLRVKAFRQADQVTITGQQSETGVSLQLIKSFDDFKQLVPKAREKAIRKKNSEAEIQKREASSL